MDAVELADFSAFLAALWPVLAVAFGLGSAVGLMLSFIDPFRALIRRA